VIRVDRAKILHYLCDAYGYNTVYNLVLRLQPWSADDTLGPFIAELREVLLTSIVDDSDYLATGTMDQSIEPDSDHQAPAFKAAKN
jgi:hypothetical protein